MEVIVLILIILICIVFYKNREKENTIKKLNYKVQNIEREYEILLDEDSKKKEYLDKIDELSLSLDTRKREIENLKSLLVSERKEKAIVKGKIIELKRQIYEIEKHITEERIKFNQELSILNKENEDKINILKENIISNVNELNIIISNKDKEISNLKDEVELQREEKNKVIQKLDNIKRDNDINKLQSKDKIMERAKFLANNNLWNDEAIDLNRRIIEVDKKNIAAYTRLAKCYSITGDYDVAEKLYKEALAIDSNNTVANNRLYELQKIRENNKFNEVIRYLENQFNVFTTSDGFNNEFLIFYNDNYNPYRKGENIKFRKNEDGKILSLKNNNIDTIKEYSNLFNLKLKGLTKITYTNNIVIMSIPSSRVGNRNGINLVAENIGKENRFLDKSKRLIRIENIQKLATGRRRGKEVHLNSIKYEVDECDLSSKIIILIDDIITTGNSLAACREILIGCGAKYIVGLGIGRTAMDDYCGIDKREEDIWNY